ncbi:hypothetical protein C8J57DRAFT_1436409 [Mycena rebaudengoi]|nr:hypothetical protein C8J57DRAFT_1436409 [Mycena rebaudengoi]
MLDITRHAMKDQCGKTPTDEQLWKCLHQSYECGTYWQNIPTYEHWGICPTCQEKKHKKLLDMTIGLILGCGHTEFKNSKGKKNRAAGRLFRILISESAHIIWKLRNERVISGRTHSDIEIHNIWVNCSNMCLKMDQLLTNISRYSSRATKLEWVLQTWDEVLMDNVNLPENWIWQSGVLYVIGIAAEQAQSNLLAY